MNIKRSLLVGATIATVATGVGSVGLASADTPSAKSLGSTSIVDKLASKFNLNKSDVQAVFDEDRATHQAQMEANQKQTLTDAVNSGTLTQAQADHITSVMNEIKALHGDTSPDDVSASVRDQIKSKSDDLHQWAKDNNIDMRSVMGMHGGHHRGMKGDLKPSDTDILASKS